MRYLLGDKSYDADHLHRVARDAGAIPVILGRSNRKRAIHYDKQRYVGRHLIENAVCTLKDFRRVPTRYAKLAATFCPQWLLPLPSPFGADHTSGENCG